ncbi:ABC transporter substrate-binding protein [Polaromonas sp.]|uniref:ABC transporter substrate-binding protein n=1 Tax=Polaromonas sp. TaxID=1869339 RepID=UPI002BF2750F|nr:ABC transporter substrate-binding protein [Polaromonas sp.]HQS31892.1 ABC transporter substrate-binding protein [Polaromonas sp.]HQS91451.1 ABC transporter substrate-binding protein [Polaromonas sp.]
MKRVAATIVIGYCAASAQAQIKIGQTAGYTGIVAAGVKETAEGAKLYLDMVNSRGGVHGQKIELLSLDDKFDPKLAQENARVLIEEKNVLAMFLTRGTPHTEAIMGLLDKHGVPLVGPSTGAMVLHQPVKKHIFNVRATYQLEAEKAIAYLHSMGVKRIALVQTDDSFGADGATGALKGLAAAGLMPVLNEKFDRVKPDFSKMVVAMAAADAQAVMMIASSTAVASAVAALRAAGARAQIVTLSNNASGGFVKGLTTHARGVLVSQVFPSERAVAIGFVKEAQDLMRAGDGAAELSPAMLEGFVAAKVLVEGLRRAGPAPSRLKLQAALENMKKFDVGGMVISYSADDHSGLDFVDLSIIGPDGKFKR